MTITQQEIIALAVEAGLAEVIDTADSLPAEYVESLATFARLAAQQERNACLAEIETGIWMDKTTEEVLAEIATAIRARNEPCRFCNGTGERDSGGSQPWGAAIMVECECQQSDDAYHRGVRDEREALKSICEELEQHYSDYAATALLNGDVDLSNAASGEPRACRAMIDAIRARSAE